ncbi:ABC transporter permease [Oscillibacter sp.]|uniref:ABC transporter permease n=1 Tax=Oscillibacter sp. TaxID=1945593 RepID=UPI0026397D82|nr:ABC transporter permease [Oscillibacter sp.]MDD3347733.1 ABC transporter permease [Oscillibacter sp.]
MNFTQSFKLAIKALRTSKMRAFLTMLGIIIGVGAVIVILSLGNGLTGMVDQQVESMGVNLIQSYVYGRGDGTTMTLDPSVMYDLVAENPDVLTGVSPYISTTAKVRHESTSYKKSRIYGVSEVMYKRETAATLDGEKLAQGRFIQYIDVDRRQNVCVIGAFLAQDAFRGDALGKNINVGGVPYTVIGVFEQSGDSPMQEGGRDDQIYIPYGNALELTGSRNVSMYLFTSTSRDTAAAAKELVDAKLYQFFQSDDAYYTMTMAEQVTMINAMMGTAMLVLVAIAAISLLVGGIGIMNIMLVSVTERTREIGIRKSLGAKRRDIRRQFIIEAGTTSAIGGMLGILFGCALATLVGTLVGGYLSSQMNGAVFSATPTLGAVAVSFGVSVGIGVLFGYLPANKAAKLNPIDALRYE